jgi:hypothetical protein
MHVRSPDKAAVASAVAQRLTAFGSTCSAIIRSINAGVPSPVINASPL